MNNETFPLAKTLAEAQQRWQDYGPRVRPSEPDTLLPHWPLGDNLAVLYYYLSVSPVVLVSLPVVVSPLDLDELQRLCETYPARIAVPPEWEEHYEALRFRAPPPATLSPAQQLRQALAGFTGSTTLIKYGEGSNGILLTEGARHLAEAAGCFWLMDIIASATSRLRRDTPNLLTWRREGRGGQVEISDGSSSLHQQVVSLSDLILDDLELLVIWDRPEQRFVVLLPSEN